MSVKAKVRKLSGYEAAQSGAAFFLHSKPGYIYVSGDDRLDFIQRQTTNDITTLHPGRVLQTILTTANARILDVFYVLMDDQYSLGLVTLPGTRTKTADYLEKRVFFMDKVKVVDSGHEFAQADIEGPSANEVLTQMGINCPSNVGEVIEGELGGLKLRLFSKDGFSGIGYRILVRIEYTDPLLEVLESSGVERMTDEEHDTLRVESGFLAAGKELVEDYTPLEVNLQSAISTTKGCYTGQEVIARQINYDKITKRLVGLQLEETVRTKAVVRADGKPVGEVTSVVQSPRFGKIGLAVIRRPYDESGMLIQVSDGFIGTNGRICGLPFR